MLLPWIFSVILGKPLAVCWSASLLTGRRYMSLFEIQGENRQDKSHHEWVSTNQKLAHSGQIQENLLKRSLKKKSQSDFSSFYFHVTNLSSFSSSYNSSYFICSLPNRKIVHIAVIHERLHEERLRIPRKRKEISRSLSASPRNFNEVLKAAGCGGRCGGRCLCVQMGKIYVCLCALVLFALEWLTFWNCWNIIQVKISPQVSVLYRELLFFFDKSISKREGERGSLKFRKQSKSPVLRGWAQSSLVRPYCGALTNILVPYEEHLYYKPVF